MTKVKAICFDLDDTLWDLMPSILHAEQIVYQWFAVHCPRVTGSNSIEDIRKLRAAIGHKYFDRQHDLSFLRLRCYEQLVADSGYEIAAGIRAFDVFQAARNEVELFDDVLPALKDLGADYALFSLSNGNADVEAIGLSDFFHYSFTAKEIGCAKPDTRVFDAVCKGAGLLPAEILHVGDDPHNDIAAPLSIGMPAVWLNRKQRGWPVDLAGPVPEISDLSQLRGMLGV